MCNMFEQLARHSSSIPEGSINGYIIVMIRPWVIKLSCLECSRTTEIVQSG